MEKQSIEEEQRVRKVFHLNSAYLPMIILYLHGRSKQVKCAK
jgi:hypothetical protein